MQGFVIWGAIISAPDMDTGLGFLLVTTGVAELDLLAEDEEVFPNVEIFITVALLDDNKDWVGFISTKSWFNLAWKSWKN